MILGRGWEEKEFKVLIRKLDIEDDVVLLGFVNNFYFYIKKVGVFVLLFFWEGLVNVLIEVLVLGIFVVFINCFCGLVEVLNNGKYGFLVFVGDS